MNGNVYLVEKSYFGIGKDIEDKVVQKIYCVRQSKEKTEDGRIKRKCVERIAQINLDELIWTNFL